MTKSSSSTDKVLEAAAILCRPSLVQVVPFEDPRVVLELHRQQTQAKDH
jgi:hypothetical protein